MRNVIYADFKNKPETVLKRSWMDNGDSVELEPGLRVAFFWGPDGLPHRLSIFTQGTECFLDMDRPGEPVLIGVLKFRRVAVRLRSHSLTKQNLFEISEANQQELQSHEQRQQK